MFALSPGTVLLDRRASDGRALLFQNPKEIVTAYSGDSVREAVVKIERLQQQGLHLAGVFNYECGLVLNGLGHLLSKDASEELLWFGAYENAKPVDLDALAFENEAFSFGDFAPDENRVSYLDKIRRIQKEIEAGETYQVNLSTRLRFAFDGDPLAAFLALRRKQKGLHGALLNTGRRLVLSLSPELFFEIKDGTIRSRPMKGTIRRGRTTAEDAAQVARLQNDAKTRSENLMIVDLIRNDLARVSKPGTVEVKNLFTVEKYETLFQMTSEVQGQLVPETPLLKIMESLFPCGSVTGAPKIRTMEIIQRLESSKRGAYCGSIGHFAPDGSACFNVAIRTLEIEGENTVLGIGGGVLHDSDPDAEYDECLLKARFLTDGNHGTRLERPFADPENDFEILETFLRKNGAAEGLEEHLERMADSAVYFDFPFDRKKAVETLEKSFQILDSHHSFKTDVRVRLRLNRNGDFAVETANWVPAAENPETPPKIRIAAERVDSQNVFLFHKTTRRQFYERHRENAVISGLADFIFQNERGEVTEGTIHNLFVKKNGILWTPALDCGLLPGIFRARLLKTGEAKEKVILPNELAEADEVLIANSVRGLQKVRFVPG